MSMFPRFFAAHDAAVTRFMFALVAVGLLLSFQSQAALAQMEFEKEPINYGKSPTNDPVTKLQKQLNARQSTCSRAAQ